MEEHTKYIKRCLQLAKNGLGTTYPNPLVGSVIVYNNRIIGEGWHYQSGCSHAEVNAINSVIDKNLLKDSTIYVSLEPCSHFGKTPPCADLIIKSGIPKVVIATVDTFKEVSGQGIEKLINAGIEVECGVLENEAINVNKRFFTFHNKKRPYIILKWAQTLDGYIAPEIKNVNKPVWISNKFSRQLVHKWRSEEQAILVGTNTVFQDNPSLTTRDWVGKNPVRVIIDRDLKITSDFLVLNHEVKTIIITAKSKENSNTIFYEKIDFNSNVIPQILNVLYMHQLQSVIVEGGKTVLESFIENNYWDEARVFISDNVFNSGVSAPRLKLEPSEVIILENDKLFLFNNSNSN